MDLKSIMPMTATKRIGNPTLGQGQAAVWYPDGDMAAEVHGNLGSFPDPIDALEMAKLFAGAPAMLTLLKQYTADDPCAPGDPRYLAAVALIQKIDGKPKK